VNLSNIGKLKSEISRLHKMINEQGEQIANLLSSSKSPPQMPTKEDNPELASALKKDTDSATPQNASSPLNSMPTERLHVVTKPAPQPIPQPTQPSPKKAKPSFNIEQFLMGNGLLWLGGIVLAFGGVFLAKYSIEAGLFPPELRIILGALFGIGLVGAAEYLYRNSKRFQITSDLVSAAIASGGLITCFAMTFVAFDFYAFLSPTFAFLVLALITLAATSLSLRYGPILALIGIVGAYAVPAMVSTGSNNVFALLVYVAFVSVSAVWVESIVKRRWLWLLAFLGNMGWLFISIVIGDDEYLWPVFGFILFSVYAFVLQPILGWKLNQTHHQAMSIRTLLLPRKEQFGIIVPVLAFVFMHLWVGYQTDILPMLAIISALLLMLPFRHSAFDTWPFIAFALSLFTFLMMPVNYDYSDNLFAFSGGYLLSQVCAFIAIAYCLFAIYHLKERHAYLMLLVLAPITHMGLSYALSASEASKFLYPLWSLESMIVAAVFAVLAVKSNNVWHKMTFLLLANGALSLTFTMLLSASVLSLAVVGQIALMAFLSKKYHLPLPNWLYKVAITAVLVRLTLAPWLTNYASELILGLHWSIVIYPIVFGLLWIAHLQVSKIAEAATDSMNPSASKHGASQNNLAMWFKGAMLHLVALFVTTETSYLITGSYPDFFNLTYQQSIMLSMNWLILSAVYLWRKRNSSLQKLYTFFAIALAAASAILHVELSIFNNPFVSQQITRDGLFINWLIPLWAVPALVLYIMLKWTLVEERFVKPMWVIAGLFSAFFVNGIIRGAYHEMISLDHYPVNQQELYTYSVVWLIMSVGLIVLGQHRQKPILNKVGFSILAIVVLKAFLIDLSNLEGLYRALSFIGLGLSLVGIGWLFQRLKTPVPNSTDAGSVVNK
jgi:uncharacterized membrane protein